MDGFHLLGLRRKLVDLGVSRKDRAHFKVFRLVDKDTVAVGGAALEHRLAVRVEVDTASLQGQETRSARAHAGGVSIILYYTTLDYILALVASGIQIHLSEDSVCVLRERKRVNSQVEVRVVVLALHRHIPVSWRWHVVDADGDVLARDNHAAVALKVVQGHRHGVVDDEFPDADLGLAVNLRVQCSRHYFVIPIPLPHPPHRCDVFLTVTDPPMKHERSLLSWSGETLGHIKSSADDSTDTSTSFEPMTRPISRIQVPRSCIWSDGSAQRHRHRPVGD